MTVFCSDIDGTLLNSERTLSPRTIEAIRQVQDAGHTFVLCSSRMPASMELLEGLYGGRGVPLIAYNGGLVLTAERTIALDVRISAKNAKDIYDTCRELDVHGSFYSGDDWFVWAQDRWAARETNNTGVVPNTASAADYHDSGRMEAAPPHKIMCMGDANLIDEIERRFSGNSGVVTYRSKDTYLEIASSECSKGHGLIAVALELKVDLADCYFFGDNYNDLSAFEVVGTSVAVANSKDAVLAAASVQTARHHDDGVAVFLEDWMRRQ